MTFQSQVLRYYRIRNTHFHELGSKNANAHVSCIYNSRIPSRQTPQTVYIELPSNISGQWSRSHHKPPNDVLPSVHTFELVRPTVHLGLPLLGQISLAFSEQLSHSLSTFCLGGLDIDRLIREVLRILGFALRTTEEWLAEVTAQLAPGLMTFLDAKCSRLGSAAPDTMMAALLAESSS